MTTNNTCCSTTVKCNTLTNKLTIQELISELNELSNSNDPESAHCVADSLLLEYINNDDVTNAYDNIKKWYG